MSGVMRNVDVWGSAFARGEVGACRAHARRTGGDESACNPGAPSRPQPGDITVTAVVDPANSWAYDCTITPFVEGLELQWRPNSNSTGVSVPIVAPGVARAVFTEAAGEQWIDAFDPLDPEWGGQVVGSTQVVVQGAGPA